MTEKQKKDYYRDRVTKSLETADINKANWTKNRKVRVNFPEPTPEQKRFMRTHDMYGNPLTTIKEKPSVFSIIKAENL